MGTEIEGEVGGDDDDEESDMGDVGGVRRENFRRTRGESSASTWRAWRAVLARRWVGKGVLIILLNCQLFIRRYGRVELS